MDCFWKVDYCHIVIVMNKEELKDIFISLVVSLHNHYLSSFYRESQFQVNCISTEFTPKKHGGEKGVPFRIQIETYQNLDNVNSSRRLHAAACQIKVFKLKGADRKHKQDREKILKRPASEQDKYQPSYECTVLNDVSVFRYNRLMLYFVIHIIYFSLKF